MNAPAEPALLRARLLQVTPLLRGLLATPTGDQDHPFARVLAHPRAEPAPVPAEAGALRLEAAEIETDDRAQRWAAACAAYAAQHGGARPRLLVLPGLGAVRGEAEPPEGRPLPNHVSLVTGAAGAIGAGICRGLLQAGSHVAATDLPGPRLESLVEELREEFPEVAPDRVIGVPLDVTDPASVGAGVDAIIAAWGGVDLAVINAGVAHVAPLEELDLAAFQRLERINVEGALLVLQAMAQHFRLQGTGGDIVLISTKNVFAPGASFGAYSATKAAAHQLARVAALELAPLDVRVNMVAPDAVFGEAGRKSGLWQEIGPGRMRARGLDEQGLEDYYRSRNLLKARVTPEHVARAVLFFATRQTPTTGATLPVDGGLPDATPR
jgi:NAD(P)-dependent dehydrogenase (short-subunit alcohol dehydrogenase family)